MRSTLYELTSDLNQLLEMAEDPDVDPEMLYDTFEAVEGEYEIKAEGYAKVITELTAKAKMLDAEAKRILGRADVMEKNAQRIKKRLEESMIATGNTKFKTDLYSFGIQKNPPRLVIDDEDKIPDTYLIPQPPKVDAAAIKKMVKETPVDWAHLEQSETLRIR
jgi:hypothetical protein